MLYHNPIYKINVKHVHHTNLQKLTLTHDLEPQSCRILLSKPIIQNTSATPSNYYKSQIKKNKLKWNQILKICDKNAKFISSQKTTLWVQRIPTTYF